MTSIDTPSRRPRVVIVGAGFGGLSAAKQLARAPFDITIVDRPVGQVVEGPISDQQLNSTTGGAHNMRDGNMDRPCWCLCCGPHPLFGALE